VLCIEKKKFDLSLEILQKAERWNKRTDILPKDVRTELAPHILDAMAFYFYKNGKNMSAMTYTRQALEAHQKLGNLDNECIAQVSLSLRVYFSMLSASCFMWSGALDSSGILLSYFVTSLP